MLSLLRNKNLLPQERDLVKKYYVLLQNTQREIDVCFNRMSEIVHLWQSNLKPEYKLDEITKVVSTFQDQITKIGLTNPIFDEYNSKRNLNKKVKLIKNMEKLNGSTGR